MPGRNQINANETPNVLHARVVALQKTLNAMPPKMASGEIDKDEALAEALSGLLELAEIVDGLVKDYDRRF